MSKCRTCEHASVKHPFYDVKCLKRQHHIYNESKYQSCEYYEEKKNTKPNKENSNDE